MSMVWILSRTDSETAASSPISSAILMEWLVVRCRCFLFRFPHSTSTSSTPGRLELLYFSFSRAELDRLPALAPLAGSVLDVVFWPCLCRRTRTMAKMPARTPTAAAPATTPMIATVEVLSPSLESSPLLLSVGASLPESESGCPLGVPLPIGSPAVSKSTSPGVGMGTGINDGERSRSGSAGGVSSLAGASGGAGVGGVWLSGGGDGHELGDARVQVSSD
mmetsp:Transcript_7850/g.29045  ORF Transcript_7850/g.29045 Transcript_7850/m.29045 type:complete len:221 (-) Transcript_7850:2099-2761(-)